ncbi:MAG: HlyD family secretion protein, partial [Roseiarcus sp.]
MGARTINPKIVGLAVAALGAGYHLTRVASVLLGKAEPHHLGSLSFAQTAALIVTATAAAAFVVGYGLTLLWNALARMPARVRFAWSATIVAVAVGAAFAAWAALLRPVNVAVAPVATDVAERVYGLGTVGARVESNVGFKVGGVLVALSADQGDIVKTGDVLARLDARDVEAQLAVAEAGVTQARANVIKAQADVTAAEATLANLEAISNRRTRLAANGVVSKEEAETNATAVSVAEAGVTSARAEQTVAAAALLSTEAQATLQRAILDNYTLRAPYDARVVSRSLELGAAPNPGQTVFTLVARHTIWVLGYVDERLAGALRVGQPADITLRSRPDVTYEGHIERIEMQSDPVNEERLVDIAFDRIPDDIHL